MLSLLILIPILSAFMIVFQDNESRMKKLALQASLLNFLLSVYMWIQFDSSVTHYQFIFDFKELTYLDFNIGVDGISIYFVLLTTFLTPVALLSNYNNLKNNIKYFLVSFLLLESLQICVFVVLDLLLLPINLIFFKVLPYPLFL